MCVARAVRSFESFRTYGEKWSVEQKPLRLKLAYKEYKCNTSEAFFFLRWYFFSEVTLKSCTYL